MNTTTEPLPPLPTRADLAEWEVRCRHNFVILSALMGTAVLLIVSLPLLFKFPAIAAYVADLDDSWKGRIVMLWELGFLASVMLSTVQIGRLAYMTGRSWLFWGAFAFFIPFIGHFAGYAALTAAGVSGGWLSRNYRWLVTVMIIVCLAEALTELLDKFGQ